MKVDGNCEFVPCLLCGELSHLRNLATHGRDGVPCHVSICPNDGLVFLSPRWTKEQYRHFYHDKYDRLYPRSIVSSESDEQRFARAKEICLRLSQADLLAGRKHILDVGAGMGWALEYMRQQLSPVRCSAIEPSQHCADHIRDHLGFQVISSDADSAWNSTHAGAFDLVIMRHVLEHFLDPLSVLRRVRDSLAVNGIVYLAVPNMMRPRGSLVGYWYRGVHTFYFSSATLQAIAARAGLYGNVVHSHGSEMWGVFHKGQAERQLEIGPAQYREQIRVLRRYQYRSRLIDMRAATTRMIPQTLRTHIRKLLLALHPTP